MKNLVAPFVLSVLALVGCASATDQSFEDSIGTADEPIQLIDFLAGQAALAQDGSTASKATGAAIVPFLDVNGNQMTVLAQHGFFSFQFLPVRGTCGVTFISPHYAMTASHCFGNQNVPHPESQTFTVQQFDITTANGTQILLDSDLSGTSFPNYTGTSPASVAGFHVTNLTCRITARCQFFGPNQATSADPYQCTTGGDVTMINCSNRSAGAPWLGVASSDPGTGPVEMYWFHEVVNAPLDAGSAGNATQASLVNSYTNLDPNNEPANWHYIGASTNALVPLKSIPWPNGLQRTRTGVGSTDQFACHGTSGSGVLQHNPTTGNLELLGTVHSGNFSTPDGSTPWANNRLCTDPTKTTAYHPGLTNLVYNSNFAVNQVVSRFSTQIFRDRNSIIIVKPPIGTLQ